jgi:hypothetical protein
MSQWYLSKNGKAQGPLGEEKIISLIEEGEVGHLDLVFKAGDTEWLPISEVSEFNTYLKKNEPAAKLAVDEAEWVLLKKTKGEKGSEYSQLGPFSKDQVLDLIERGEIRFKDFAWRQGLDAWVPIGEVSEFADPLPSTPKVDTDLYESVPEVTQIDEDVSSMSELIEIEHFEHEKTQVMSASDIPLNSTDFATETDFNNSENFSLSESEISETQNTQADIEMTDSDNDIDHATDADLWSLQPPETKSDAGVVKKKIKAKKVKPKKQKPKAKKREEDEEPRSFIDLSENPWPWVAAAGILFLSVIFLYMSFSSDSSDVAQKDEVVSQEKSFSLDNVDPKDYEGLSLDVPPPEEEVIEESSEFALNPQNDPQLNMGTTAPQRKISSKPKLKKKPKVAVKRKIAKKKKKRRSSVRTSVAGASKAKSFYKQRDRKALFYSSLKVERLITELEQNFKKLKKKKKSWKKFYSRWRKRARSAPPSLVKKFPQKRIKYAYPKLLASFKKDHRLVIKYGDVYNAKVLGLRRPAGVPKNLKAKFAKHKKQAQRLGR